MHYGAKFVCAENGLSLPIDSILQTNSKSTTGFIPKQHPHHFEVRAWILAVDFILLTLGLFTMNALSNCKQHSIKGFVPRSSE
jgi:hypothetical protein